MRAHQTVFIKRMLHAVSSRIARCHNEDTVYVYVCITHVTPGMLPGTWDFGPGDGGGSRAPAQGVMHDAPNDECLSR